MNHFHLDSMLTLAEAAAWLQIPERTLEEQSRGLRPRIPAFRPTPKKVRFHPRSILAKLASGSGLPVGLIAASYGFNERGERQG